MTSVSANRLPDGSGLDRLDLIVPCSHHGALLGREVFRVVQVVHAGEQRCVELAGDRIVERGAGDPVEPDRKGDHQQDEQR